MVLTGANTYDGVTTISEGTLQVGDGGTGGSLTGAIVNNAGLVVDRAGSLTLSAGLSGNGTLVKNGPGTLVMSGNFTQTGNIFVNDGTLQVDTVYTGGGLITVASGATLGGVGLVGRVDVQGGGTFGPGASPGLLEGDDTITMAAGSVFEVDLNGLAAGTEYDQLVLNDETAFGFLDLSAGPTLSVSLGFTPAPGASFLIVDGPSTGFFAGLDNDALFSPNGSTTFRIAYNPATDITLTVIPEPTALALALAGLAVLATRRFRGLSKAAVKRQPGVVP